jgi:alpha-L-fucosidase
MLTKSPTARQLEYLDWEFGIFLHFGLRTFYEGWKDWDSRPMDASRFNPTELDCDQWARIAREAGARYMVLTTKHHDGFSNWPSAQTNFGVHASPWRGGRGDVVREYVDACRRHGLAVGLYYSPADSASPVLDDPEAYDEYFLNQLRELLGSYGAIDIIWFDGCGSEEYRYDWERIVGEIRRLQPQIIVFNMGEPDIRWIGNEAGIAPEPHSNLTNKLDVSVRTDAAESIGDGGERWFLPAECDCMMRAENWFYQEYDADTVKSVEELVGLYYHSVGRGANLLINIGPDRRGLLPDADVKAVLGMRAELDRRFARRLASISDFRRIDDVTWEYTSEAPILFDHVVLEEDLTRGETITGFSIGIQAAVHGTPVPIHRGQSVGHKRIVPLPAVRARAITIRLEARRGSPALRDVQVHHAGPRT